MGKPERTDPDQYPDWSCDARLHALGFAQQFDDHPKRHRRHQHHHRDRRERIHRQCNSCRIRLAQRCNRSVRHEPHHRDQPAHSDRERHGHHRNGDGNHHRNLRQPGGNCYASPHGQCRGDAEFHHRLFARFSDREARQQRDQHNHHHSQNSFSSATTLSATGLPTGVTAAFSANPVTPPANGSATSVLTLTASATATIGTATVTVTGTSGSLNHSTTIALTVSSSSGAQTAVYNSALKAPECATVGTSCDSGPSLLLGRDHLSGGTEPNQPNTINNSCADGTEGTFHSDESNDRIVVTSTSGGALTHATTATVTATVWAWSGYTSDSLDLYYAANANSPSWVFIKTIKPTKAGAQSLSATFTLPTGSLQAVRAQFRYLGKASSCTTGSYNDHDDLIFAV